jgi:hypothetical protein
MSVRFVRLSAVTLLVVVVGGPGLPDRAHAAESGLSPSTGTLVTSETVTVSVHAPEAGGELKVDGVVRDSGADQMLTYTIDGSEVRNGAHSVEFAAGGLFHDEFSSFWMAAPAAPPSGVTAELSGRTVTVTWDEGTEPDLTGYTVTSPLGTKTLSAGTHSTTFAVPAAATGSLSVGVVAERSGGAAASDPSTSTVVLKPTLVEPEPAPAPSPSPTPTKQPDPVSSPSPASSATHTSITIVDPTRSSTPSPGTPAPTVTPAETPTSTAPTATDTATPAIVTVNLPTTTSPSPAPAQRVQVTEAKALSEDTPNILFDDPLTAPALAAGLASVLGLAHTTVWARRHRLADVPRLRALFVPTKGLHVKPREAKRFWD